MHSLNNAINIAYTRIIAQCGLSSGSGSGRCAAGLALAVCLSTRGASNGAGGMPGDVLIPYSRQTMERLTFKTWDCSQSRQVAWQFEVESAGTYYIHMRPRVTCGQAVRYLPSWPELVESANCLSNSSFVLNITIKEGRGQAGLELLTATSLVHAPKPGKAAADPESAMWFIPNNDPRLGPVLILQGEGVKLAPGVIYTLGLSLDPQVQIENGLRVTLEIVRFDSEEG